MDLAVTALRVAASLAGVLGLVWLLARGARRRGLGGSLDTSRFTVVGRHSLGRNAGVTVVRIGDEALVLGVTEQSVQLLARTPLSAVTAAAREAAAPAEVRTPVAVGLADAPAPSVRPALAGSALSPATWSTALDALRERTTRR
jgi:flagellar protein FliO/FliZ